MRIDDTLTIDEKLLEERFVRSSGPGGQNVNKLSTAVELRFDLKGCTEFNMPERERLVSLEKGLPHTSRSQPPDNRRRPSRRSRRRLPLPDRIDQDGDRPSVILDHQPRIAGLPHPSQGHYPNHVLEC